MVSGVISLLTYFLYYILLFDTVVQLTVAENEVHPLFNRPTLTIRTQILVDNQTHTFILRPNIPSFTLLGSGSDDIQVARIVYTDSENVRCFLYGDRSNELSRNSRLPKRNEFVSALFSYERPLSIKGSGTPFQYAGCYIYNNIDTNGKDKAKMAVMLIEVQHPISQSRELFLERVPVIKQRSAEIESIGISRYGNDWRQHGMIKISPGRQSKVRRAALLEASHKNTECFLYNDDLKVLHDDGVMLEEPIAKFSHEKTNILKYIRCQVS